MEGLGSDHPENENHYCRQLCQVFASGCMGSPWNTFTSGMPLRSEIPTSTCARKTSMTNSRKHHTLAGMEGTCRQVPGMRARRARAGGGMTRAIKEKICTQRALSTLVFGNVDLSCRSCLWNMYNVCERCLLITKTLESPQSL